MTCGREMHGLSRTREYRIWHSMKQRCINKNDKAYQNYGGRGIAVCNSWKSSFLTFYQDMGPRPTVKHTLERVDNNQGYFPENVIWALRYINRRNQRNTKLNTNKVENIRVWYSQKIFTARELSFKFGVSLDAIYKVISYQTWRDVA